MERTCAGWSERGLEEDALVHVYLEEELRLVQCQFGLDEELGIAVVISEQIRYEQQHLLNCGKE